VEVSIAISQSSLLKQTRQQVQHEATLNQISRLLHSPLNVVEIDRPFWGDSQKHRFWGRLYITAEPTGQPAQLYAWRSAFLPRLEESFWQQMMSFPKDALKSTVTAIKKDIGVPNVQRLCIITDLIKNLSLSFSPCFQDNFNSLNPDYAAAVLSRMCRVFYHLPQRDWDRNLMGRTL